MADDKKLPFSPAVELSYLTKEEQGPVLVIPCGTLHVFCGLLACNRCVHQFFGLETGKGGHYYAVKP